MSADSREVKPESRSPVVFRPGESATYAPDQQSSCIAADENKAQPQSDSSSCDLLGAAPSLPAEGSSTSTNGPSVAEETAWDVRQEAESLWKQLPVPDGPDQHDESYSQMIPLPNRMKVIGSSVRGKKHKHEGSNRDDWFEIETIGSWTIIAVADGAGSKKFSRIGAKEACQSAVAVLKRELAQHEFAVGRVWPGEAFAMVPQIGFFKDEELDFIRAALWQAMRVAWDQVQAAAIMRMGDPHYEDLLGHRIQSSDLSTTLIIAVHTVLEDAGRDSHSAPLSLVMSCSVGDGIAAFIDMDDRIELLMKPDSGAFPGETEFLSDEMVKTKQLSARVHSFKGHLKALFVMTDGVADDYLPYVNELNELYRELVSKRIVGDQQPVPDRSWKPIDLTKMARQLEAGLESGVKSETDELLGSSSASTAPSEELAKDAEDPGAILERWLDSYYVRGSFDDRTLVTLYSEVPQ